jgi:UPF0716 family protein affecting phage T7 exclusion
LPVLALVILDIFAGSALIRRSGINIFTMLNTAASDRKPFQAGQPSPFRHAGLLLIIPGSSAISLLALLLPWVRKRVAGFFESHISGDFTVHRGGPVIEMEAVEIEDIPKLKSNSPLED